MKKLRTVTVIFLTILFISCSSDDNSTIDTNAQEENLIGTWNLSEIKQEGTVTSNIQGIPVQSHYSAYGKDINAQVTFTQNPNNFTSSGNYTSVVTVTILGQANTQEFNVSIDDFLNLGTCWSLNKGVITINQGGKTVDINIIELTTLTLKLEMEIEEVVVEQGITNTTKTKVNMTLTK